jgi:acetoin:2,6-dichlorophenolindophenol oxidoreductase subunit beta
VTKLSYTRALNQALAAEMERDPAVFLLGEDVRHALTNVTAGLYKRFGPERIVETPLSEQGVTNFATGAAMAGLRPVVEYQIPFLLMLVFEQIVNQANKFPMMSGGQARVPVTYLLPAAGWRSGWGAQHSDEPYSLFAHYAVKTVVPATPSDAFGLFTSAIRDDDPVVVFAPIGSLAVRQDVVPGDLVPVPLGTARVHRQGHVSVEVFDPRTLYPFDWDALAASLAKTGRLVVVDDSNRTCGMAAEILATATEEMHLVAPPRRITRPDGAILGSVPELDLALQPSRQVLADTVLKVVKSG